MSKLAKAAKGAKVTKAIKYSPQFPSLSEWSNTFRIRTGATPRVTLGQPEVLQSLVGKLNLKNIENMTAVEIYPGLGSWTSALANSGIKNVIALEPQLQYYDWMVGMGEEIKKDINVIKKDGYDWETYVYLKNEESLALKKVDWSEVHPNILFTGTFPRGKRGEMLLAQFSTCVVNKMALHSLGRIQMAFWVPDTLYNKYMSPPKSVTRCKMSVVAEASVKATTIYTTQPEEVYPNSVYHLLHIVPNEQNDITAQWDVFEYVLKHLFVMQKQPLTHMIKTLGPGADIILSRLSFDPNIPIGELKASQIDEVAMKFDQWPLRPRVLFEDASVLA